MQEVNNTASFADIAKKEQWLVQTGAELQKGEAPPQLKVQYLKVCDAFSQRLLQKGIVERFFEDPRENLIKEIENKGLIENNRIMGKPIGEFIVEAYSLGSEVL